MPYIPADNRPQYEELLAPLARQIALNGTSVGDLNFCFYSILVTLWNHQPGYATGSKLRAVLNDVNSEFYDQIMRPYEDRKCRENGPITPLDIGQV